MCKRQAYPSAVGWLLVALRRWWRWCRGEVTIRNSDLPPGLCVKMEGPRPPDSFVSNGSSFSPDRILAADLRPAAHQHDWEYSRTLSERDRLEADARFYRNLLTCGLPAWMARRYYYRVRFWGALVCDYGGIDASRPRGWRLWRLLVSRYVAW